MRHPPPLGASCCSAGLESLPFVTGWSADLLALLPGVWQCFWLGYLLLDIAAEERFYTGADHGVPTGARLCVGNLQAGVGARGWGVSPTLGLEGFGCVFTVFWLCGPEVWKSPL